MKIDLQKLNYKDKVEIDTSVEFPDSYFESGPIMGLENIYVKGFARLNDLDEYLINLNVTGIMYLPDSITLEKIAYPLNFEIDENLTESLENNQLTLDILEFLWQNIVLEVPIRYTKTDADNLSGENWQVLNEDRDKKIDPRLQKLYDYKGGE